MTWNDKENKKAHYKKHLKGNRAQHFLPKPPFGLSAGGGGRGSKEIRAHRFTGPLHILTYGWAFLAEPVWPRAREDPLGERHAVDGYGIQFVKMKPWKPTVVGICVVGIGSHWLVFSFGNRLRCCEISSTHSRINGGRNISQGNYINISLENNYIDIILQESGITTCNPATTSWSITLQSYRR